MSFYASGHNYHKYLRSLLFLERPFIVSNALFPSANPAAIPWFYWAEVGDLAGGARMNTCQNGRQWKSAVHFLKVIFHIRKEKISWVYIYVCAYVYTHTYPLTHHGMDCHFYLKKERKNCENVSLRFIPSLFCTKLLTLSHFWIGDGRLSWFSVSDHFYTSFFLQNPRVKSQSI